MWIKTGDGHYHFVEPWVIDRPFCRMETVYQNHFVERGWFTTKWAPQPPPGNGKEDYIYIYVYKYIYIYINVSKTMLYTAEKLTVYTRS